MNSPNPREDRFAAILRLRWTILESKAISRVSQSIRSRVDVSQIVNDAAHEWIQRVGELERLTQPKQLSDERLVGLLMKIVEKRSPDAIRDVNAWKRGGRIEAVGSDHLQHRHDPHCVDCFSEMQAAEMRSVLDKHLDRMQQQVLDLHYDGYSETAIAEQLGISLISLQRIRKTIASLAEGLILRDDQTRRGSQKARGKRQEARKNSFEKWEFFQRRTRRLRLIT
ncbi:MAG: helix-turn-helix domain-containing protein [Pirellula sp.]